MRSVPYNWSIGLAVSDDLKKFKKFSNAPIIGPRNNEPYLHACPIVYCTSDGYEMYLLSGDRWINDKNGKLESVYTLKKCISKNGIDWSAVQGPLLTPKSENECQTSCSIFEYNGKKHMLFSYRSGTGFRENPEDAYKIGLAMQQSDGSWLRDDSMLHCKHDETCSGWDSMMMAYPHVFHWDKKIYMLYCGNEFGRTGFGLAELVE